MSSRSVPLVARPCRNTRRLPAINPPRSGHDALVLGRPLQIRGDLFQNTSRSRCSTRSTIVTAGIAPLLSPLQRAHASTRFDSPSIPTSDHGST